MGDNDRNNSENQNQYQNEDFNNFQNNNENIQDFQQPNGNINTNQMNNVSSPKVEVKTRHIILTIYYILAIVVTSISLISALPILTSPLLFGKFKIMAYLTIFAAIGKIAGDILILCWKKIGAYLGMISIFVSFVVTLGLNSISTVKTNIITALLGTVLWLVCLLFVWDGLEPRSSR